ncbi:alpha/beta hydrolase [Glycomyces salinus]|uniref:alpha/beta hydrolase n=1 Tax=Glycomyces salinus TaxID=980294 RepID=UPI0018EB8B1F|nr:alpha/beta hydrolase [Glycomyces salinus]
MNRGWWRRFSLVGVVMLALVYVAGVTQLGEAEADSLRTPPAVEGDVEDEFTGLKWALLASDRLDEAQEAAVTDPEYASELASGAPDPRTGELSAALATLSEAAGEFDPVEVGGFFDDLDERLGTDSASWLAVMYPAVLGSLPGAPFEAREAANQILLTAASYDTTQPDSPERPWNAEVERPPREEVTELIGSGRQFVYIDPYNNAGDGSWIEVVGDLETAETVSVLVPGGSAVLTSDNFDIYYQRAQSFVDAADGELAVVVWAGASWPSGWIEESWASWAAVASESLASFTFDLRSQIGPDVPVTLVGHSYGGAVIGLAETQDLAVDRVLHIASAGMGNDVYDPEDLDEPCRPRYSITAPGDPISYIQGMPYVPLLGHGADPDDFPGVKNLYPGYLPDAPDAVDDTGTLLIDRGISGKEVEGVHSHSEIFYPESDAWNNILAVLLGQEPELDDDQPAPIDGC